MSRVRDGILVVIALLLFPGVAAAHPVPFTFLDVRIDGTTLTVSLVAHVFDLGHDLRIDPAAQLLEPEYLTTVSSRITALVDDRLHLTIDGRPLASLSWTNAEALPDRQSVRVRASVTLPATPGIVAVNASMFPYDPAHETFINFYEGDAIGSQAILDQVRDRVEYFVGNREGVSAIIWRFVSTGAKHILTEPDHLVFLAGLLLLGGSIGRLVILVTAFTVAHSVTLSLAALDIVAPPARLIEPAISLSIVYVGADNLMVRGGRDVRIWIAGAFGLIHGFGFANVLRGMDLPRRALVWCLISFNTGLEVGQLVVVVILGSALVALRRRNETAGRQLALVGSIVVIVAGTFWFIERVFFPGGIS